MSTPTWFQLNRDIWNARRRQRYATDAGYRETARRNSAVVRARQHAAYLAGKSDPEIVERRRKQAREYYARTREVRRAEARARYWKKKSQKENGHEPNS